MFPNVQIKVRRTLLKTRAYAVEFYSEFLIKMIA